MNREIGEEFDFRGVKLKAEVYRGNFYADRRSPCDDCFFQYNDKYFCWRDEVRNEIGKCSAASRKDKTNIVFKKI